MATPSSEDSTGRSDRPPEVRDPHALRALAHPTRLSLLEILTAEGAATATRCAELLGERVASCSFHLRTLARYGFVEPVPHQGREKPWRRTSHGQSIPDSDLTPEQKEAASAFLGVFLDREFARLRDWQRRAKHEPKEWEQAALMMGSTLWLTPEELDQLGEQLRHLADLHRDRAEHPEQRPEAARPVRLFLGTSVGLPGTEEA